MKDKIKSIFVSLHTWQIMLFSVIGAVLITDLVTALVSLWIWHEIQISLIVLGTINAILVPLIILPVVIRNLRRVVKLEEENQNNMATISQFENQRQLEAATQRRVDEMSLLYRLGVSLTSGENLYATLLALQTEIVKLIQADAFYVAIYDEATDIVSYPIFFDDSNSKDDTARLLHERPGLSGAVIFSKKTLYLPDMFDAEVEEEYSPVDDYALVVHTFLGIPLITNGHAIGMLSVQSKQIDAYTPDQIQLMENVALQAAIAIDKAHLLDQLKQELLDRQRAEDQLREREAILEAITFSAEQFLKTADWRTNIDMVLERLGRELNASHAYLFEKHMNTEGSMLVGSLRYEWVAPGQTSDMDNPAYQNAPVNATDFRHYYEILDSGEPFAGGTSYFLESGEEKVWMDVTGIKALLEMRIVVDGKQWGTLGFDEMVDEREWTPMEVDVIRVASNVLGAAIKRQLDESALQNELTERKRLERELQEERDFALQIINTMGQGLTVTDEDARFVLVNPAYARFMGYEPRELIGMRPEDVTLFEDRAVLEEAHNIRRQGKTTTYESQLRRKDGNKIPVLISGSPRLKDGKYMGAIASITDLTEIKRAQEERENLITELSAKNAELERFTYTVSHDLKSPLVTINGFLGYLEQDAASGNMERLKKDTTRIQEAVNKMQRLLSELLELSRIGRMMNAPHVTAFDGLVREALEIVQGRLNERNVSVHIQPNLHAIYGDKQRLVEVMQNLLDNAAKYMGAQSHPLIEIGQRGEDAERGQPVFYVKDNGMGVAPEYHERIFGLFNKLDAKSEGTGVGLALVKRIIEVHGGRIWIESEMGQGSTFFFTLPGRGESK